MAPYEAIQDVCDWRGADALRAAWRRCRFRPLRLARPYRAENDGREPAAQARDASSMALSAAGLALSQARSRALQQVRVISFAPRAGLSGSGPAFGRCSMARQY